MFNLSRFGMSHDPFRKDQNRSDAPFLSEDYKEVQNRLNYLVNTRGIGIITAAPGMGKSYAIKGFQDSLSTSLHYTQYMSLSTIPITDFYRTLCDILKIERSAGKLSMYKNIKEQIYIYYKERRKPLVLICDEAQYLNTDILVDLKMLCNFTYDTENCFTLILCGENYFNRTIERQVHTALRQRILVNYTFNGLSNKEIVDYIYHKLGQANGAASLINENALSAITSLSEGTTRIIDNLMSKSLMIAMSLSKDIIDETIIMKASNELELK